MSTTVQKKGSLRKCSVRGCNSGTSIDRKLRTENGQRLTTIFKPPIKKPELLQKWSEILGLQLEERDRVCELHFEDKCVIKADFTHLPDGTIFALPRLKYRLAPDSVPISPYNRENQTGQTNEQGKENQTSNDNLLESDQTTEALDDHQYFITATKSNQCVYYNKEVAACFMIPSIKDTLMKRKEELSKTNNRNDHNDEGMNQNTSDNDDVSNDASDVIHYYTSGETNLCMNVNNTNDDTNDSFIDNTVDDANVNVDDANTNTNYSTIDNANDNTDDSTNDIIIEDMKVDAIKDMNDNSNDNAYDDSSNEIMGFEILNEADIMPKPKLKMQEIMDYLLEISLPKTWSWMNYTKIDNGLTFTQICSKSRKVRCFVELHEDLSKTLHTGDEKVSLEIEFQLTSRDSISRMLQTVQRMKICSGTGILKESRDEDCTGVIIPTEEYKCSRSWDRCVACRKLRIKIMQARDTKDANIKYLNLKKKYDVLRRKSRYLEQRLDVKATRLKALTEMIKSVNKYGKNYQPES